NSKEMAEKPPLPLLLRIGCFFIRSILRLVLRRDGTVMRGVINLFRKLTDVPPSSEPRHGAKTADITVDASRNLWFRLFVPTEIDPATEAADREDPHRRSLPVVVFFHGGGFVLSSAGSGQYDSICRRFAREIPAVVVSVDYRLAPEHRYPAQYEDGFDALEFLDGDGYALPANADLSRCFLAGDSAGGNIAHHVARRFSESPNFSRLKAIIALQPFFGGKERSEREAEMEKTEVLLSRRIKDSFWKSFLPSDAEYDLDHEAINVSGPRAVDISKLVNFPATMVVIGGRDSLNVWQSKYCRWLKESGKEIHLIDYPNMIHAFYLLPRFVESTQVVHEIRNFVHNQRSR
ncbi:hypothetical protein M569_15169, partial [Genlisea aurea]